MRTTFDHSITHTPLCKTFWFKPEQRFHFNAGEFAEFYLPHVNTDTRGDKRRFTISSSPKDTLIGITVKFAPINGSSFKQALLGLKHGDEVYVSETMGDFVLPKDSTIPLTFVGLGIGITPMISIVRTLGLSSEKRTITVFHLVQQEADLLGKETFRQHTTYVPIIASDNNRLTANTIQAASEPGTFYYLAGPKRNVQDLVTGLHTLGTDREHIALDLFTGAIDIP